MLPYSFFPVYWLVVVVQCLKCSILQSPHSGRTLFPVESCERHKVIRLVHHLLYMTTVILLSSQLNSTQPLFVYYALCIFATQSLHIFFSFYPIHSFGSPPTAHSSQRTKVFGRKWFYFAIFSFFPVFVGSFSFSSSFFTNHFHWYTIKLWYCVFGLYTNCLSICIHVELKLLFSIQLLVSIVFCHVRFNLLQAKNPKCILVIWLLVFSFFFFFHNLIFISACFFVIYSRSTSFSRRQKRRTKSKRKIIRRPFLSLR